MAPGGRTEGRTDGPGHTYIPPPSAGNNNREHLYELIERHIKQTELIFSPLKRYTCRPIPVISCTKTHLQLPAGVILIRQRSSCFLVDS